MRLLPWGSRLAVGTSIQRREFRDAVLAELAAEYGHDLRDRARQAYRRGDVPDPCGIALEQEIPLTAEGAPAAADAFAAAVGQKDAGE
jgi:hypothetical protein